MANVRGAAAHDRDGMRVDAKVSSTTKCAYTPPRATRDGCARALQRAAARRSAHARCRGQTRDGAR
eukprot:14188926-Alexandrium_andersonii.AAC.1